MQEFQQKAWNVLTEVEKQALLLTLSQGVSSRKAGEMLKITHYKYLEIRTRAEKFFKLFSDFYQKHPSLINPQSHLDPRFTSYLEAAVEGRMVREDALYHTGDSTWLLNGISNDRLCKGFEKLKNSNDPWDKDLYVLVMEFDRWNNWRILPRKYQAPSAFTRRTRKHDKVYIEYLNRIPEYKILALVDMYFSNGLPKNRYYVAFICKRFINGYQVTPIKKLDSIVKEITNLKIYIFDTEEKADEFGLLIHQYFQRTQNQKDGLKYWKEYLSLIESAINYRQINNMDFTVSQLDNAYQLKRKAIRDYPRKSKD